MYWQNKGDYLGVVVDRYTKSKKVSLKIHTILYLYIETLALPSHLLRNSPLVYWDKKILNTDAEKHGISDVLSFSQWWHRRSEPSWRLCSRFSVANKPKAPKSLMTDQRGICLRERKASSLSGEWWIDLKWMLCWTQSEI